MKGVFKILIVVYLVSALVASSSIVSAQTYKTIIFSSKQGLHSNLVKDMIQDSLGFIWIATDNGLERFNGRDFQLYIEELPSSYVKSFFITSKGELLVVTDMGISKIITKADKPEFETIAKGSSSYTDSLLFFPKLIYEDRSNNIWIADNNSIWLLKNGKLKNYTFPENTHTLNFQRSYSIVENKKDELYVFSQTGYTYLYNKAEDKFVEQKQVPKLPSVDGTQVVDSSRILIASYDGIYILQTKPNTQAKYKCIQRINACSIEALNDSVYLIASWTDGLYKCLVKGEKIEVNPVEGIHDLKINNLLIDKKENLWLSTDFGVVLAQNLSFNSLSQLLNMSFVQSVDVLPNGNVYCIAGNAYSITKKADKFESKQIYSLPTGGNLSQVVISKSDTSVLYFATTDAKLIVFKNNKVIRTIDLSLYGRVLFHLMNDDKGNLWACLDGCNGVLKIGPDFKVELIDNLKGLNSRGIVLKNDNNGNLYCGSLGDSTYLFKYDYEKEVFSNLSLELLFEHSKDIVVNDMVIHDDNIYLATSEGIVKVYNDTAQLVDLGVFTQKSVNSIAVDNNGFIWFSNGTGLFKYKQGKYYVFRENDGLNTIVGSYRCLAIGNENQIWFGTQTGLNYSDGIKEINKTVKPIFTSILVDGRPVSLQSSDLVINNHSYIQFNYISLEMPSTDIIYKTKLKGKSDKWSEEKYDSEILIPSLPYGDYTFYVKARQHGNYDWSNVAEFTFAVAPKWHQTWWAYLLYVIALFVLVGFANVLYSRRLRMQKKVLEHKVKLRTEEIMTKNKQLEHLNSTKDKFFSIIAHDLRNPFSSIMGLSKILSSDFEEIDDERKHYLIGLIHNSTEKTFTLLENLLTWARTQISTINFDLELTNLTDLVKEAVDISKPTMQAKNITLEYKVDLELEVELDKNMINTVVRNLVMNAIKYSYRDKSIIIEVTRKEDFAKVVVIDEGVGIKPQRIEELFQINEKSSEPGTENEKGTGLGLILCKEFIEKHKGEIGVDSEIGKGSAFWFTLPLHTPK